MRVFLFLLAFPILAWDIVPDPSQAPLQLGKTKAPAVTGHGTAVFATRPSPFVFSAITRGAKSSVVLQHISMGRIAGPVTCESASWSLMRLNPDGQTLVGWSAVRGKYRSTVWSSRTGKQVWQGSREFGVQPWRDFISSDSIVEVDSDLRVWNFRTGKLTHEIELPRGTARGGIISPGGRYVVLGGHDGILRIVDLRTSQVAGELQLPKIQDIVKTRTHAMAFSDDGAELAVLLRTSNGKGRAEDTAAIVSWSMRDGSLQKQHMLDRPTIAKLTTSGTEPGIVCLPRFEGWLVWNSGLIDRQSGKLVWLLPAPAGGQFAAPSLGLRDGRIIGHQKGGGDRPAYAIYELPEDITERVAKARAGKPVDLASDLPDRDFAGTDWAQAHARLSALKVLKSRQPLAEDILQTYLRDLGGADLARKEAALEALGRAQPSADQAPRVLPVLRAVCAKRETGFITIAGFWIISQWAAPPKATVPATGSEAQAGPVADLASKDFQKVIAAFKTLGAQDTPEAAAAIGAHYAVNRGLARMTLVKMTHAREGLLKMLADKEWSIRLEALRLLGEHGRTDDIPAIEALHADPNRIVQMQVPKAIQQIQNGGQK